MGLISALSPGFNHIQNSKINVAHGQEIAADNQPQFHPETTSGGGVASMRWDCNDRSLPPYNFLLTLLEGGDKNRTAQTVHRLSDDV